MQLSLNVSRMVGQRMFFVTFCSHCCGHTLVNSWMEYQEEGRSEEIIKENKKFLALTRCEWRLDTMSYWWLFCCLIFLLSFSPSSRCRSLVTATRFRTVPSTLINWIVSSETLMMPFVACIEISSFAVVVSHSQLAGFRNLDKWLVVI